MQKRPRTWGFQRCFATSLLACGLGACAAEAPPLDDLPLRDALGADPEVIAALPADAQRGLGTRFEDARRGADEREEVHYGARTPPAAEVRDADRAREARGDDALIVATITADQGSFAVRAQRLEAAEAPRALSSIEGTPPATATADAEDEALRGHAGAIVAGLAERSGAKHVVRAVGWPAGAVAIGDAVYVNPSWLVAMAALEDQSADKRRGSAPPLGAAPPMQPLSVKGNPYVTYASIEACTSDVDTRCKECLSTGNCEDKPALDDFKTAKDECTFLGADAARPAELCALVLLSIDLVASCVREEDPACSLPTGSSSSSLDGASTFLASMTCVKALDQCLGAPSTPSTSSGTTVQVSRCEDPFSACVSSCNSLTNSCKTGSCSGTPSSSSCTSCNNTGSSSACSSCGSAGSSSSSSCGKSNCTKCETAPAPPFPFGAVAWLLAPLAYVFTRRRA